MPDVTDRPPETPPGEPGAVDNPPVTPSADTTPKFTRDDVKSIITETVTALAKPPAQQPSFAPDQPSGPSLQDIDADIAKLDAQIDQAAQEGKPVGAMIRQRDEKREQRFDIVHVAPLRTQGSTSINEMVMRQIETDPELGEDFRAYKDEVMQLLQPAIRAGQVLRFDVVKEATNLVLGRHTKELRAAERERALRERNNDTAPPMPGSTTGRSRTASAATAQPETIRERFGDQADAAFQLKRNKGMDEDAFARKMRFKDKADWFQKDQEFSADRSAGLDKQWDPKTKSWIDPAAPS